MVNPARCDVALMYYIGCQSEFILCFQNKNSVVVELWNSSLLVPGLCTYSCSRSWVGNRSQPWQKMDRNTQSISRICRISCRPMASRLLSTESFLVAGRRPACPRYDMLTPLPVAIQTEASFGFPDAVLDRAIKYALLHCHVYLTIHHSESSYYILFNFI